MRSIGLIFAGILVASCGGPGADNSSDAEAELPEEVAAREEPVSNEPAEPQPAEEDASASNSGQAKPISPCLLQEGAALDVEPIRAIGTEPFWGTRVEGRCVTYSHPENQQGTRVWTRYSDGENGHRAWVGQLGGKDFVMRVRPEAGCSDGMSDKRYPMAVELLVNGENRAGCAEPL